MTILEALDDPNLLAPALVDPASWNAWRAFLAATIGAIDRVTDGQLRAPRR